MVYVVDSRRPFHEANVNNKRQIFLLDDTNEPTDIATDTTDETQDVTMEDASDDIDDIDEDDDEDDGTLSPVCIESM